MPHRCRGNVAEAAEPAAIEFRGGGRILVYAFGLGDSGIDSAWTATPTRAGVIRLDDLSSPGIAAITRQVRSVKRSDDLALASIHWGGNWGYEVSSAERTFAHGLIDSDQIDLVYGHSSHHPKPVELYRGKAILYGCGDFLNDYEGIGGYEAYRPELTLMYFPTLEAASGRVLRFELVPMRRRRFRLERASAEEVGWLKRTLGREGRALGSVIEQSADGLPASTGAGRMSVPRICQRALPWGRLWTRLLNSDHSSAGQTSEWA